MAVATSYQAEAATSDILVYRTMKIHTNMVSIPDALVAKVGSLPCLTCKQTHAPPQHINAFDIRSGASILLFIEVNL